MPADEIKGLTYPPLTPAKFCAGEKVQHVKSGGVYFIIALPINTVLESTWERGYGYIHAHDQIQKEDCPIIYRSQKEMEDGRFVSLDSPELVQVLRRNLINRTP